MNKIIATLILGVIVLIVACSKDDDNGVPADPFVELNLPDTFFNYANIELPAHYTSNGFPVQFQFQPVTAYDNTPPDNPITDAGATLGRVLFYDKKTECQWHNCLCILP